MKTLRKTETIDGGVDPNNAIEESFFAKTSENKDPFLYPPMKIFWILSFLLKVNSYSLPGAMKGVFVGSVSCSSEELML